MGVDKRDCEYVVESLSGWEYVGVVEKEREWIRVGWS